MLRMNCRIFSIFNGLALLFRGSVGAILNMMRLNEKYMEMEKQHEKSYHNKIIEK